MLTYVHSHDAVWESLSFTTCYHLRTWGDEELWNIYIVIYPLQWGLEIKVWNMTKDI